MVYHVGVCWVFPVNIDCREIDAPLNDVLTVSGDSWYQVDWKALDLGIEIVAGYGGGKIGLEWTLIVAVGRPR